MSGEKSATVIQNELYSKAVLRALSLCKTSVLTKDNSIVDPTSDKRYLRLDWIFDQVGPAVTANNESHFQARLSLNRRFSSVPPAPAKTVGLMCKEVLEQMTTESETLAQVHRILDDRSMAPADVHLSLPEKTRLSRLKNEEAVEAFILSYPKKFSLDENGSALSLKPPSSVGSEPSLTPPAIFTEKFRRSLNSYIANMLKLANLTDENSRTLNVPGTNYDKLFFRTEWVWDRISPEARAALTSFASFKEYLKTNTEFRVIQDCFHFADLTEKMASEQDLERELLHLLQQHQETLLLSSVRGKLSTNSKLRVRNEKQLRHFLKDKTDNFTIRGSNLTSAKAEMELANTKKSPENAAKSELVSTNSKTSNKVHLDQSGSLSAVKVAPGAMKVNTSTMSRVVTAESVKRVYPSLDKELSNLLKVAKPTDKNSRTVTIPGTTVQKLLFKVDWVRGRFLQKFKEVMESKNSLTEYLKNNPKFSVLQDCVHLADVLDKMPTEQALENELVQLVKSTKGGEPSFADVLKQLSANSKLRVRSVNQLRRFINGRKNIFAIGSSNLVQLKKGEQSNSCNVTKSQPKTRQKVRWRNLGKIATTTTTPATLLKNSPLMCFYLQHLSPDLVLLSCKSEGKVLCHRLSFTIKEEKNVSKEKFCQVLIPNKSVYAIIEELPSTLHDVKYVVRHAWQGKKSVSTPILTDPVQTVLQEWQRYVALNADVVLQKIDPGLGLVKVGASPHFSLSKALRLLVARVSTAAAVGGHPVSSFPDIDSTLLRHYPELFSLQGGVACCAYGTPQFETVLLKLLLSAPLVPPLDDSVPDFSFAKTKCLKVDVDPGKGGALIIRNLEGYIWRTDFENHTGHILVVAADTQYLIRFSILDSFDAKMAESMYEIGDRAIFDLVVTEGVNNVVAVVVEELRLAPPTVAERRSFSAIRNGTTVMCGREDVDVEVAAREELEHFEDLAPLEDEEITDGAFTMPICETDFDSSPLSELKRRVKKEKCVLS